MNQHAVRFEQNKHVIEKNSTRTSINNARSANDNRNKKNRVSLPLFDGMDFPLVC